MNALEDGSSGDLTGSFAVVAHFGGNGVRFKIANNGTTVAYVIKLQCRGRGIYDYEHAIAEAQNPDSIDEFGENAETIDMAYQSSISTGLGAARYLLSLYKDPLTYVHAVTLVGHADSPLMTEALAREISDRVGIAESITGLADIGPRGGTPRGYFINAIAMEIVSGEIVRLTWTLAPGDTLAFWLLGVRGRSELGRATRLGHV